ncbi:MAG: amino acid ABC transporter substrate-binding protein, partial [Spirochaetes bacterium]
MCLIALASLFFLLLTSNVFAGGTKEKAEEEAVKIGAIFPLTGASAHEGLDERRGVELAVKQINDDGGINGRPLRVIFEDSESRPEAGVD